MREDSRPGSGSVSVCVIVVIELQKCSKVPQNKGQTIPLTILFIHVVNVVADTIWDLNYLLHFYLLYAH